MRILFIGDIYGEKGREALHKYLPQIKREYKANLVFANGENSAHGLGITHKIYKEFMSLGINVVTMGNHTFGKKELVDFIDESNICRPANYGKGTPGKGYITIDYNGKKVTVINMLGRIFLGDPLDNPFIKMDEILEKIDSDVIILDFHAEATSEKYALAHYLDGRITAMVGTHTHVPTCDNIIFPKGLMYISDIGMTGVKYGIIGGNKNLIIKKFLTGMPSRTIPEDSGVLQFNAVLIDTINNKIERINIFE